MTQNNPQVPWTDEQWARVQQVVQEEASRARVAATFLPLVGPLPGGTDFVREDILYFRGLGVAPRLAIDNRHIWQLATLQIPVYARGAEMADPEITSVLALFRRAANVLARLEDAVIFNGLAPTFDPNNPWAPPRGAPQPPIWRITGGERIPGLYDPANYLVPLGAPPPPRTERLVTAVARAIGVLENHGHFGPFAVVLDQHLFLLAVTPNPYSMVMPQDRIIPFLGGGPLLRSSTLRPGFGVVVALGGDPVELILSRDMHVQFLQITENAEFVFRVSEKMALRIKERAAIVTVRW
jgi:uncharacterized linocin/CFP29 family protein